MYPASATRRPTSLWLCPPTAGQGGDVLNVGFGLGIIDTAIQSHRPRSHTIIEAHPDVYK